jgi:glycosyltransferase involved in cell wall biosynthesis
MEALALQRPVISTFVAGIPELVTPGVCGWLVPAGSTIALCEAIRSVLHTPTERLEAMGEMGAMRVREHHCAVTEAQKLRELFFPGGHAEMVSRQESRDESLERVAR